MNCRQLTPRAQYGWAGLLFLVFGTWTAPARGQDLGQRLNGLITDHKGKVAVCVKNLKTGQGFRHRADQPMPTASLIKLAVMAEAYRQADAGLLDLRRMVVVREEDKVPGSGIITPHLSAGASFNLRDCVRLMMAWSDNTATNLVLDAVGLPCTSRAMEELGLPNTKIHSKVFRRDTSIFPERSEQFGLGSTTAAEMVRLLEMLHQHTLASAEACQAMKQHLLACEDKRKFPRFLPPEAGVMHKTGSLDRVRTDAGLLATPSGPVALCVLTAENEDTRWTEDNAGDLLCAKIARAVYDHYQPVKADGVVAPPRDDAAAPGQEVIRALGTDEADEIEAEPVRLVDASAPRAACDALEGPPFTSCKAWLITDARTGATVAEQNATARLDVASLTKIMTARLVLEAVANDRRKLDELVPFSRRADETTGSSCGLRAGERVALRDLLYGLLLPSGNDAAVALAEQVAPLLPAAKGTGPTADPVARFVSEMNRAAGQLGLKATRFANPHGLPAANHGSTALDLAALTRAAMEFDLFREIVSSREHQATVLTPDGGRRLVTFKSTNRLLAIEGYTGVKTGFTKAAGSCLVSSARRGQDELIMVVLGSPSAAAAVADSRNLYRWAWRERGHQE